MISIKATELRGGLPEYSALARCARAFEAGLPRLNRLGRYYEGRHDILARTRLPGQPNHRVTHAWPRYIAQVSAAYLLGEAVRLEGPEPGAGALRGALAHAGTDSIDIELALNQAVFGRAVSLCYEDGAGQARVCSLDPRGAFLVYDDTVARAPLFGVRLGERLGGGDFTVYTADSILTWPRGNGQPEVQPHPFGALPMAEYLNGTDARGDFEDVLALVDAYDLLAADRLNDRAQFSDAMLVLTGVMGVVGSSGDIPITLERLRQERTLSLPDEHARAEWLVKTPQEKDIEVLRAALAEDIHKFSLTPDFTDERFAGNASGIAIKYKLFNFDNRVKLKERFFITGLRERARALCGWLYHRRGIALDADTLSFTLSRRLPVNELERAQTLSALKEVLAPETLAFNSPLPPAPHPRPAAGEGGHEAMPG